MSQLEHNEARNVVWLIGWKLKLYPPSCISVASVKVCITVKNINCPTVCPTKSSQCIFMSQQLKNMRQQQATMNLWEAKREHCCFSTWLQLDCIIGNTSTTVDLYICLKQNHVFIQLRTWLICFKNNCRTVAAALVTGFIFNDSICCAFFCFSVSIFVS